MKKSKKIFIYAYIAIFILGIRTLFHGFPDIERFFAEWLDERLILNYIIKFGTLNFAPTEIWQSPLYHYLTFIPIALFYLTGVFLKIFTNKLEFLNFYFNNTQYFFLIGRSMSYLFFWLSALAIYKMLRLFYNRHISNLTVLCYVLVPRFIFDFATTRPETLLALNATIFTYFFLKYYLKGERKYLFLSAFFLGISTATKYNALFLSTLFIPLLYYKRKEFDYNYRFIFALLLLCLLIFIGFFICNPFFIIKFKVYFYNFGLFNRIMKDYINYCQSVFILSHLKELVSFIYLNIFGFLILIFGGYSLFKKDRKLFLILFYAVMVYEIYFGIVQRNASPLRYLNPLIPIAAFLIASGIEFIVNRRKFIPILFIFTAVLIFNYFDLYMGICSSPTYLQAARKYIEENIPEHATICIVSNNFLPQLNITKESYYHLLDTTPKADYMVKNNLKIRGMDDASRYSLEMREARVNSMIKSPSYNLVRFQGNIVDKEQAALFLKTHNVKYILGNNGSEFWKNDIMKDGEIKLVKKFSPVNKRLYGDVEVFLYKVNSE